MSALIAKGDPKSAHGTALCWAARTIALCVGGGLILGMIAPDVVFMLQGATIEYVGPVWPVVLWFAPLLSAAISWRWHLIGGSLMTMSAIGIGATVALNPSPSGPEYQVVMIPIGLVVLGAGILHLVVWRKESSSRKTG
jgi:cytochrome c-type biogenesis protein CcmH/NrfF